MDNVMNDVNTSEINASEVVTTNVDCYIVKQASGQCEILSQASADLQSWGPFASRSEAIAKRVGLIRSGKCLPK